MKKLILETLSFYQKEKFLEKLLKNYLFIKEKKDGSLLIKLVSGLKDNKVMIFDPTIEEELDSLYDHLYPIVVFELEHNFKYEFENMNTKRVYELIENVVDNIINLFSNKNVNKKGDDLVEKYVYRLLKLDSVGTSQNLTEVRYKDRYNLSIYKIKEIFDKSVSNERIKDRVKSFYSDYKNYIFTIYKDISETLGLSYRDSKKGILIALDKFIKKYVVNTNENLSDIIRKSGYRID